MDSFLNQADIHYYMQIADLTALRSKAERLKVGCVMVSVDRMMAIGYNGTPAGCDNTCEEIVDGDIVTKPDVIHAEMNSLIKFLNSGISSKGSAIFLTHSPCMECSKAIYLSRVSHLYYRNDFRSLDGVNFLRRMGVFVEKINSHARDSMDDYDTQTPHNTSSYGRDR